MIHSFSIRRPEDGRLIIQIEGGTEDVTGSAQLLPGDVIRSAIDRELYRSERSEIPLVLILFSTQRGQSGRQESELNRLSRCLLTGTRQIDLKGWWSHSDPHPTLALLLYDTPLHNAQPVVERMLKRVHSDPSRAAIGVREAIEWDVIQLYPTPNRQHQDPPGERGEASSSEGDRLRVGRRNIVWRHRNSPLLDPLLSEGSEVVMASCLTARALPAWKRLMDCGLSVVILCLFSPLMVLISTLIKLTSSGPVFFRQQRIGINGKPFVMLKFRSMRIDHQPVTHQQYLQKLIRSDAHRNEKPMQKLDSTNRDITMVGRFIRRTYLDELPQLFNVLKGEMSLVGPRPCLEYEAHEYLPWHCRRFLVRPGMTGLWQVSGKNRLTFSEMMRLDIRYARNCSPWLDCLIILRTPGAILMDLLLSIVGRRLMKRSWSLNQTSQ